MNWLNKLDDVLDTALRPAPTPAATTTENSNRKNNVNSSHHESLLQPLQQQRDTTAATTTTTAPPVSAVGAVQKQTPQPLSQNRAAAAAATAVVNNKNANANNITTAAATGRNNVISTTTPGRLKRGPTTHQHNNATKTKRIVMGPTTTTITTRIASSSTMAAAAAAAAGAPPPSMESESEHQPPAALARVVVPDDKQQPLLLLETNHNQTGESSTQPQTNKSSSSIDGVIVDTSSTLPRSSSTTATAATAPAVTTTTAMTSPPRGGGGSINTPGLVRKIKKQTSGKKQIKTISTSMLYANKSSPNNKTMMMNDNDDALLFSSSSSRLDDDPPAMIMNNAVVSSNNSQHQQHQHHQTVIVGPAVSRRTSVAPAAAAAPCDGDGHAAGVVAVVVVEEKEPLVVSSCAEATTTSIATRQDEKPLGAAAVKHTSTLEKEKSSTTTTTNPPHDEEETFKGDEEEEEEEQVDSSFVTIPLSERGGGDCTPKTATSFISAQQDDKGESDFSNNSNQSDNSNQSEDRNHHNDSLLLKNPQEHAVGGTTKPQSTHDGDDHHHHESDTAELGVAQNEQLSAMSTAARQIPPVVVQEDRIFQVSSKSRESDTSSLLAVVVGKPIGAKLVTRAEPHDPQIETAQVGKKLTQRNRDPLLVGIESLRRPSLEHTPSSVMRGDDLSSVSGVDTAVDSSFPQQVFFRSDFDVDRLLSTWGGDDEETHHQAPLPPWDTRMNCYGVVHVRVLRAQRLPCSVGSSIHAVVSLPPWKGMVRTRKAKAFAGSGRKRGVCTDWTETETSAISMVHAYSSNEESPVPSIHVDLMMSTLGMFEFKISSLTLPCETLLRSPLVPRRNWFLTSVPQDSADRKHVPLLQIEAMFEPDEKYLPLPSPSSAAIPMDIVAYDSRDSLSVSLRDDADMPPVSECPSQENDSPTNLDDVVQGGVDRYSSQQPSVDVAPSSGPTPADDGSQQHSITVEHTESIQGKSIGSSSNSGAFPKPTEAISLVPTHAMLGDDQSMADLLTVSLQSLRRQESAVSSANAHLLRLQTYYKPASCAVCKRSIMSVWRKKAYHCEACGVDCCSDCRLHIDVQLVCGSEEARAAVEDAIQSKLTSEKILRLVAPIDESNAVPAPALNASPKYQPFDDHKEAGIGVVKIDVLQAIILANPLPADSDAVDNADCLRSGDFYVRVSRNGTEERNARTRTVQNSSGRPKFDAEEIRLSVPNYATEFRIEVVDASTDQPVGATLLTTQALLQEQRDLMTDGSLRPSSFGPFSFKGKRWIKTELRTGLKTGFGTDFFPDVKQGTLAAGSQAGGIVGMIEVAVGLEEDFDALYGKSPYECPPRPPGELDLNVIQGHIVRFSYLINDMKSVVNTYAYIISWENPFVTALSLVLFVRFCFWYDPAHTGASSIFLLLLYMVYLAFIRFHGSIKRRFVERELSLYKKKAKVEQAQQALHRPVGLIRASVVRGKNLRSPELGLPGNAGCHVYLDLTRFMDSVEAKELELLDEAVAAPHELGATEHVYATNPTWKQLAESDEAKRLRQLLPTHGGFFEVVSPSIRGEDEILEFPVLQPFDHASQNSLMPWSASKAAAVLEVKLYDVLTVLPGSEYSLGEVVVPLSTLAERSEISGWFKLTEPGKSEHLAAPNKVDLELDTDAPQVLLYLRWVPPQSVPQLPPETEREASVVIQEELVKSATLNRQSRLGGVVGSSIGAINSVRALSGHLLVVQNSLGMVLDAIESIRNGFNFTDPFKSAVLFAVLSLVCLLLTIVPTRAIVLAVGILQYVVTFKSRFGRLFKMGRNEPTVKTMNRTDDEKSPVATWVMNAIRGLPTDMDLKRTYHWETRRLVAREVESQAEQKRTSRLRRLWRAQWYATVELVQIKGRSHELTPVFAMIQGHRFLWWRSVEDFDQGEDVLGRIFLQGHAGLASPSPLELKAVRKEDLARLVGIFGRGADKQERLTLLCTSVEERDRFEAAIFNALTTKND